MAAVPGARVPGLRAAQSGDGRGRRRGRERRALGTAVERPQHGGEAGLGSDPGRRRQRGRFFGRRTVVARGAAPGVVARGQGGNARGFQFSWLSKRPVISFPQQSPLVLLFEDGRWREIRGAQEKKRKENLANTVSCAANVAPHAGGIQNLACCQFDQFHGRTGGAQNIVGQRGRVWLGGVLGAQGCGLTGD